MTPEDQKVVTHLRTLRERYEAERRDILDSHMLRYIHLSDFWRHCKRSALEVESWPDYKKRRTYSGTFSPKEPS
jgi:hypothetical protein